VHGVPGLRSAQGVRPYLSVRLAPHTRFLACGSRQSWLCYANDSVIIFDGTAACYAASAQGQAHTGRSLFLRKVCVHRSRLGVLRTAPHRCDNARLILTECQLSTHRAGI
jgi:hypothetical protein